MFFTVNITFCIGHNKDYSSMSVPVTFTNTTNKVLSVIPVFQDKIIEDIETFDLNVDIPSSVKHRISLGRQRNATASIIDSTSKFAVCSYLLAHYMLCIYYFIVVIRCPANFKVIAIQKSNSNKIVRKEIRSTINNTLDIAENITTDQEAFTKITETLKIKSNIKKFVQFQNAMNEISEASYEACHGSESNLVLPGETLVLIDKFEKAVHGKKSTEARHIFGRLLCLRQRFQANNTLVVKWFGELNVSDFHTLFFDEVDDNDIPTLAFVVDDTESMEDKIDAVKRLIKTIIKAEKASPFFYVLGTFNDPGKLKITV